jgi:replicative DNA helicase
MEDDESIDQMEGILNQATRDRVETFDPGIKLGDKKRAINSLLRDDSEDVFPTGIKELDQYNLGPKRKTLHILVGLKKVGKTRWLVQLAQHAAMQDAKVLHVSLEMDEERMLKRYYQSFFAIAQHRTEIRRSKFKKDEFGRLTRVAYKKAKVRLALDDKRIRKELGKRIDRFGRRLNNIIIKSFPTRQLTFNQLVAYIDRLEIQEQFVPDLLIVDYPKLMRIDMNNFRLALGALLEDLRGLGVERNMAVATVAQSHRVGKGQVGKIDTSDIGEDFSQTQTLDVGLVYRQTKMEAKLGLARIYVDDARDVSSGWEVLIAQNYSMGQFCVDSIRMRDNYMDLISKKAGLDNEEGEET